MIEIIKEGTKHELKCEKCGCLFSYETEDILRKTYPAISADPLSYSTTERYVKCPQCDKKIIL